MSVLERKSTDVLVIDDDELSRLELRQQLMQMGKSVIVADSGEAALTILRQTGPVPLVVSDLHMPGIDGIEFLRHLVELHPQTSVIVVSGQSPKLLQLTEALVRAHGLCFRGWLSKPVALDDLRRLVFQEPDARPAPAAAPVTAVTEAELESAIRNEEIEAFVQPKVDTRDGRLMGAEALARWIRPGLPTIPPDQFIPLAERTGLIDPLTDLMFRRALQSCGEWARQGIVTRIAINLSVTSLHRLDLPERITEMAREFGVNPHQVIVEVTESGMLGDGTLPLDILIRLRLRGISLSIDDFGTGHSSLLQLKRLHVDELKIDRTFIHGMLKNKDDERIVISNLKLAEDLGVSSVVAEGVEEEAELRRLAELHCPLAQGYFIARPFPRSQLADWARSTRRPLN